MKNLRQEKILELIKQYDIETQEELAEKLIQSGFSVTQATVSRDIRALNLVKSTAQSGGYKYVQPHVAAGAQPRRGLALSESVTSIDYAGNLVVIKTYPGMAQPIATCVDAYHSSEILGCVAGDDSILVVIRDPANAKQISEIIRKLLKND